jgi:uncharacterized protein YgiM (DUF1202 family)
MSMSKAKRWVAAGVASIALALAGVAVAAKAGDVITVQVISAKLMKNPKLIGPSTAAVGRGTQLTVSVAQNDWYQVSSSDGKAGWIHKSNVVEKKVALSSKPGGGGSGGASEDEVALAGRGFSKEVEDKYKDKHPNMDFSHVDNIEKYEVDTAALEKFAMAGKIGGGK